MRSNDTVESLEPRILLSGDSLDCEPTVDCDLLNFAASEIVTSGHAEVLNQNDNCGDFLTKDCLQNAGSLVDEHCHFDDISDLAQTEFGPLESTRPEADNSESNVRDEDRAISKPVSIAQGYEVTSSSLADFSLNLNDLDHEAFWPGLLSESLNLGNAPPELDSLGSSLKQSLIKDYNKTSQVSFDAEAIFVSFDIDDKLIHLNVESASRGYWVEATNQDGDTSFGPVRVSHDAIITLVGNESVDDTLVINMPRVLDGSNLLIEFDGGEGGFDSLEINGPSGAVTRYTAFNAHDGLVIGDGWAVQYTGLEPITDNANQAERVFDATDLDDVIILKHGDQFGYLTIESQNGTFESISFPYPEVSLTINAKGGNDRIIIESPDPSISTGYHVDESFVTFIGSGTGDDLLELSYPGDLAATDVGITGSVSSSSASAGFAITFTDVPEQLILSGGLVNTEGYSGESVVVSGVTAWQEEGPAQILSADSDLQNAPYPQTGAVNALAIQPGNDKVIFAASVSGGVWRTEDGGQAWKPLTDNLLSLSFTSIAIHSHDIDGNLVSASTPVSKLIVFAGTGNRSSFRDGGLALGLYRSINGGDSWQLVGGAQMAGLPLSSIIAQRVNGQDIILVGAEGTVEPTFNWSYMQGSPALDFAGGGPSRDTITRHTGSWIQDGFAIGDEIWIFRAGHNDGRYKIHDIKANASGLTGTVLELEAGSALETFSNANGAYVTVGLSNQLKEGGIFRSIDGGASFQKIQPLNTTRPSATYDQQQFPEGSVTDLVADPGAEERFYAAVIGGGVYRSDDAGASWSQVNNGISLEGDGLDNNGDGYVDDIDENALGASRILLAVQNDPNSAINHVYAALVGAKKYFIGAFQSSDQGDNWSPIGTLPSSPKASLSSPIASKFDYASFVHNANGRDYILRDTGSWVRDGFLKNQTLTVIGSSNNDATYLIDEVTSDKLFLDPTAALNSEFNLAYKKEITQFQATPTLTFADRVPASSNTPTSSATITRNVGSWLVDGFAQGHVITVGSTGSGNDSGNDGSYEIASVQAGVLTLKGYHTLQAQTLTTVPTFSAYTPNSTEPTTTQPQVLRGSQGDLHFSLTADALGNVYLGGDRPPHIFRWDQSTGFWSHIMNQNASGTRSHADSRFLVIDGSGQLLTADDGGVYRLLNPGDAPMVKFSEGLIVEAYPALTGNPLLTFSGNTITRSAGSWDDEGFIAGHHIEISGSSNNDGIYTISEVSGAVLKVASSDPFKSESPSSDIQVWQNREWKSLNSSLGATEVLSLSYDPINDVVFAGTQDNGVIEQPYPGSLDLWSPEDLLEWSLVNDGMGLRPGDGNTTAVALLDLDGDSSIEEVRRYTMSNNLTSLSQRLFDENGEMIIGSNQIVGLEKPVSQTLNFVADSINDHLTINNHGLVTGDGPLQLKHSGQDGLPGGVSDTALYWAIKIDAHNIQLAGNQEDALNGTKIDLTSQGGGLQQLVKPFISASAEAASFDVASDTITIPNHGLRNAQGPFHLVTSRGSVLPQDLKPWQPYFVIKVDNNTLKLANSKPNAIDGTSVDLRTVGSGSFSLVARFTGIEATDVMTYTNGFNPLPPYVVNKVDSTRMLLGLQGLYASVNLGNASQSFYDGLDSIQLVDQLPKTNQRFISLVYGGRKNGVNNPDVIYASRGSEVFIKVENVLPEGTALSFRHVSIGNDKILRTDGLRWDDNGFAQGSKIKVSGSARNDGTYEIHAVSADGLALILGPNITLQEESGANQVSLARYGVEKIPDGQIVRDVVLDPENYDIAYAVTDKNVYQRNTDGSWARISDKLYSSGFRSVDFVRSPELMNSEPGVLLVGTNNGLYRSIAPGPSQTWSQYGSGLPHTLILDLEFTQFNQNLGPNPNDLLRADFLTAASFGRGVWQIHANQNLLSTPAAIKITGGEKNDIVSVARNPNNASYVDIFLNSDSPVYTILANSVSELSFDGSLGNDVFVVDNNNGPLSFPSGISYDGGGGDNQFVVSGGSSIELSAFEFESGSVVLVKDVNSNDTSRFEYKNAEFVNTINSATPLEITRSGLSQVFIGFENWLTQNFSTSQPQGNELALINNSLARVLTGATNEQLDPAEDPVESATQLVQSGSILLSSGLERLIEGGQNGFNLSEIGDTIDDFDSLRERIDSLDDIPGNVILDESTDHDGDGVVDSLLNIQVQQRLSGQTNLRLKSSYGIGEIDISGDATISMDVTLDLIIGFDSTDGFYVYTADGGSGIQITNLELDGDVDASGRLGFLEIYLDEVALEVDPELALAINLKDPNGGDEIHFGDLVDVLSSPDLLTNFAELNITGSDSVDLDLSAGVHAAAILPGFDNPIDLGDARINAAWDDITQVSNVEITFSAGAGQSLIGFLEVSSESVYDALITIQQTLDRFDLYIPVVNQSVDDLLGFVEDFESEFLAPLREPFRDSISFSTIQDLIRSWNRGLADDLGNEGIQLDLETFELSYTTQFQSHHGRDGDPMVFELALGSNHNTIGFSAGASVEGHTNLQTTFGLDLGEMIAGAAFEDVFFIKNTLFDGSLTLTFSELDSAMSVGSQSLQLNDGTLSLGVTLSIDPSGADSNGDGKLTLAELNAASLTELIDMNAAGSMDAALPFSADLSIDPLSGFGLATTGDYLINISSEDLFGSDPVDVSVSLDGSVTILGQVLNGAFTFHSTSLNGEPVTILSADPFSLIFASDQPGAAPLVSAEGSGHFVLLDEGVAGKAQVDLTTAIDGLTNLSGDFEIRANTLPEAFQAQFSVGDETVELHLPSGPYLRVGGQAVSADLNFGSLTQTLRGDFIIESTGNDDDRRIILGLDNINAAMTAGSVSVVASGGSGAFLIQSGGVAGEILIGEIALEGVQGVTMNAVDLSMRFNNTGSEIDDGETEPGPIDVQFDDKVLSFQFNGAQEQNMLSISGAAEIILEDFLTLTGKFVIEQSDLDTDGDSEPEEVFAVGVEDLSFTISAGSYEVFTFSNGNGGLLLADEGIAGAANMQFELGIIGLAGDVALELNTLARPISASIATPGGDVSFDYSDTEFLRICIGNALLTLGSTSIPIPGDVLIDLDTSSDTVDVVEKDTGVVLVSIDSQGSISTGLSFSDFAMAGPFEYISLLRQLLTWFSDLSDANAFDVDIPFTDTTLGQALDWSQLFMDEIYSKMASIEIQSTANINQMIDDASGLVELADVRFKIQIGDEDPVEIVVNGSFNSIENPTDPNDPTTLVGLFNNAFLAAGAGFSSQVVARRHREPELKAEGPDSPVEETSAYLDRFVIALQDEAVADMLALQLLEANGNMQSLGFGVEQTAIETHRYSTEEFFVQLGKLFGIETEYDAAKRVYTYPVNKESTFETIVPLNFDSVLGDLGDVAVEGLLHIQATVGFDFTLGFDLGASEVPRIVTSAMVPTPSNGQISDDANFQIFFNDDPVSVDFLGVNALSVGSTSNNQSIEDLADDLNQLFATVIHDGLPVSEWIVAQKAGNGLAISVREENLGVINRLTIRSNIDDPFAAELGFGSELVDLDGHEASKDDRYFVSTSTSGIKGLFIEDVALSANPVSITTLTDTDAYPDANPNGLIGSFKFGFVELATNDGAFGTLDYQGAENPLSVDLGLRNSENGESRFYLNDLFETLTSTSFGDMVSGPNFDGSFLARLRGLSLNGFDIGDLAGNDPEVSIWIPDINDLDYNPDAYDGSNSGIFVTYPNLGHLESFQDLSFAQMINALRALADNLGQLSAFGFLDQKIPVIDASVNDLLDYASKFAELIEEASKEPSNSLQSAIIELESKIEALFNLDPSILGVSIDTNNLSPVALTLSGGNVSSPARTILEPDGDHNDLAIASASNGSIHNGVSIRLVGDSSLSGDLANVHWDDDKGILTLGICGGVTRAVTLRDAINSIEGTPFIATLPEGQSGIGTLRTTALKFELDFTAAYGDLLPLQLDLNSLLTQLAGDNGASAFLDAATTLIQVNGSGNLEVSASASLNLDVGIDLTDPSDPEAFFYDSTGITLLAKVLGRDVAIETSLGSAIGIFIEDGEVTIDRDGDPDTNAGNGDRGVEFAVTLNDLNGDHRIYLSETWLNTEVIDVTLEGGVSVSLPIYAPNDGLPLGSSQDEDGDGHADNELYIEIADFGGLFAGENVVTIITPDFNNLLQGIDFCAVLENSGLLVSGLDKLLGSIEEGLETLVESNSLPMLGDGFGSAANFISDFRNGLLASIQKELDAAGGSAVTVVENALKRAFWQTIGPDGLDLLVDPDSGEQLDATLGYHQLDIILDCENGLIANLRLRKTVALVDNSKDPIDFDIGVPGFGLEVDGQVSVAIGFDLKFGFGLNKEDGFYFDSSAGAEDPELRVFFEASIPGLAASGSLAFLELQVGDDPEDPSSFVGQFVVDLKDPDGNGKLTFSEMSSSGVQFGDIFDPGLEAIADLNLDLSASFGGNAAFPRVVAQLQIDWVWSLGGGMQSPEIVLSGIALDLGSFISDFLDPILKEMRKVTEPFDPIIEIATEPLPVLSDLAGKPVTLLDLAELYGVLEPTTVKFIENSLQLVDIINNLPTGNGSVMIPYGSFALGADENGNRTQIQVLDALSSTDFEGMIANAANEDASGAYMEQVSGFAGDLDSLDNFSIPIFKNPTELFNLFIGEPVRLVEWQMPTFDFSFTYTQKIPIYPPLYAHFGGSIGAKINVGFGYDTFGIQKFIASEDKNMTDLLDGFYVLDFDANGRERPELELRGEIFAGASISLLAAEAGVSGGIYAVIGFDLNDVNDDGKVRISEMVSNAQIDPRCIFDIHGEMGLFLEAFLSVDLFFFSIDKTWRFAEISLFEFDLACPEPVLASKDGSGVLTLHMGEDAEKREEIDTTDSSETFLVRHLGGNAASESVEVQWGNYKQAFQGVTQIKVNNAGQGDDLIDLRGVMVSANIEAGPGNDTIYLSDGAEAVVHGNEGDDTIVASSAASAIGVTLYGDAGNDLFVPGTKSITIHGGSGGDVIQGSPEGDFLYGDNGDDLIYGEIGDDYLEGGSGKDLLDGAAGSDVIYGGPGMDLLQGGRDNDLLHGGEDEDVLSGGSGNDLLIGGTEADEMYGHSGIDLLIGDDVTSVQGVGITRETLFFLADIPTSGIQLEGLFGIGNDFLVGGGNVDVLFGGAGDDFLYGGNMFANGQTLVIEEDHNDFFDGGSGNDFIFGDDAMGRTGERDTGIEIRSAVFFDNNKNDKWDEDEIGFGGVEVELRKQSDDSLIAAETTTSDGSVVFKGLDPNQYYLVANKPTGLGFIVASANHDGEASSLDSDVIDSISGRTATFGLGYDEVKTSIAIGYVGDPLISIDDISIEEPDSGVMSVVFTITLSGPQLSLTSVDYTTFDATAKVAEGDYQETSGTLEFAPGVTRAQVSVPVLGDLMYEEHEQFVLALSNPSSGVVLPADPKATATIVNNDPIPEISISDFVQLPTQYHDVNGVTAAFDEGKDAEFIVSLTNPSYHPITVSWVTDVAITSNGMPRANAATPSGLPDPDFHSSDGRVVFEPGETYQTIKVRVLQDDLDEAAEAFDINLFDAEYAFIADSRGVGIIADDDDPVSVSIAPVVPFDPDGAGPLESLPFETHVQEGNTGSQYVEIEVTLSERSSLPVTVNYATSPGTAVGSVYSKQTKIIRDLPDYEPTPQAGKADHALELVFAPGETQKTFTVEVFGDNRVEPDEDFYINLLSAENAVIASDSGLENNHVTVVVENDDGLPGVDYGPYSIWFSDAEYLINEPDQGSANAEISVLRADGSSHAMAILTAIDLTATGGIDYDPLFREFIVFEPGQTSKTVTIPVHADDLSEGNETVLLLLQDPTGDVVNGEPYSSTLVILDADMPELSIVPKSVKEDAGDHAITVKLSAPAPMDVRVKYQTVPISARSESDFVYQSDWLTILQGQNQGIISVNIVDDAVPEGDERFAIRLLEVDGPAKLLVEDSIGVVVIHDNDDTSVSGRVFYDANANGFQDHNERGINGVDVEITYFEAGIQKSEIVQTATIDGVSGVYHHNVFLGQVGIVIDGATVTSPYKGVFLAGSGSYATTTDNESQVTDFLGAKGISPFEPVGYDTLSRIDAPAVTEDIGRGGTDDTIFGGPGDDRIEAGAGDDHVVGGHWMTATDSSEPINSGNYDVSVKVSSDPAGGPDTLHNVYDEGPIFEIDLSSLPIGGTISGSIWQDSNNSNIRDDGDFPFTQDVVVHLYDSLGNAVNSVVTNSGHYDFQYLHLKENGDVSGYLVAFDLPQGWDFVAPDVGGNDNTDSDVIAGNRTLVVNVSQASSNVSHLDAGVELSDTLPISNGGGYEFGDVSYSVSQVDGSATIEVVRGDSTRQGTVIYRTQDGSAKAGEHYDLVSGMLLFGVGENYRSFEVPIHDTGMGISETAEFSVILREPTGRPLDEAVVNIYGDGQGTLSDDDLIFGGDDWDIILGDSGSIPAEAVIADDASLVDIVFRGGPGKDFIDGGNGPDYINSQLDDDIILGGEGEDAVYAGLGDDEVWADLDNDQLDGQYGQDTIVSVRDVVRVELSPERLVHFSNDTGTLPALSTFTLNNSFEIARIKAGASDNVFVLQEWFGDVFVDASGGSDTLHVTLDSDMNLSDVELPLPWNILFKAMHGFVKDASISTPDGQVYHLGSVEWVRLTGGESANHLDASNYSKQVVLEGSGGNDVLEGGSGDDYFVFDADDSLGDDVVVGHQGVDWLDFSATSLPVTVDMGILFMSQIVNENLSLLLNDEIEAIIGGSSDDNLRGNFLDNTLLGGPGDDRLAGGIGDEIYSFDTDEQWGLETIIENEGEGYDIIDFSHTSSLSVVFDLSNTSSQVINQNLSLVVTNSSGGVGQIEGIIGGEMNDILTGNNQDNTLVGGPGLDILNGAGGDDLLDGGIGEDVLMGGEGIDTIRESDNTDFYLSNSLLIRGIGEVDHLEDIEIAYMEGAPGHPNTFVLTGWGGIGGVDGMDDAGLFNPYGPAPDRLTVHADADFVLSDTQLIVTDEITSRTIQLNDIDHVTLIGGPSNNTIDASAFTGNVVLIGAAGDDVLIGGLGADLIEGNDGDDTLSGGRGADTLSGGPGMDSISEDLSGLIGQFRFVLTDLSLSIDEISPVILPDLPISESDQLQSIEFAEITGSPEGNVFEVSHWSRDGLVLNGGLGIDTIQTDGSDRIVDGNSGDIIEAGDDIILLSDSELNRMGFVPIELHFIDNAVIDGKGGNDRFDTSGFSGEVLLIGGADSDQFLIGGGNSVLYGDDPSDPNSRSGDDRFVFVEDGLDNLVVVIGGIGLDTIDFSEFSDGIEIDLNSIGVEQVILENEMRLILHSADIEAVIGGSGDDTIIGDNKTNYLTGGPGSDRLDGGNGSDYLIEQADTDFKLSNVSLLMGGDNDILVNITHARLTGGVGSNLIDASAYTGVTELFGLVGDDTLIGGKGPNTFEGGPGNDILIGSTNNDHYKFDVDLSLGNDVVQDNGLADTDWLDFGDTTHEPLTIKLDNGSYSVHPRNLRLELQFGTIIEGVIDGAMSDIIVGNSADNIFSVGEGHNQIDGGGGTKNIVITSSDSNQFLSDEMLQIGEYINHLESIQSANLVGGDSANKIDASGFTMGPVSLSGLAGNDYLIGGVGDDWLLGGAGFDRLSGHIGNDFIFGGPDNDWIDGGGIEPGMLGDDNDLLDGGTGNDIYFFDMAAKSGIDTIAERNGEGFADLIIGAGLSGADILDLFNSDAQVINGNLTIVLINPGAIENAF